MKNNLSKAIIISVMWISCAVVAVVMRDPKVLMYAVLGTVLLGLYTL